LEGKHKALALLVLVVLFGYWSFRIIAPFLSFVVLGLVLAFLCHPIYKRVAKKVGESAAAGLVLTGMLLLIIIPSLILTASLVKQATSAYQDLQTNGIDVAKLASDLESWTGVPTQELTSTGMQELRTFATSALPSLLSRTGEIVIGLLLMVFTAYYALKEGRTWYDAATSNIPMRREYKTQLRREIEVTTRALFFGQALTAVLLGLGCGIVFWLVGVQDAVFWGFVMLLFAFLPFLGTPMVYIPWAVVLALGGAYWPAAIVLVACTALVIVVDYVVRPKLVSGSAGVHPLVVIAGAFGGIIFMGFVGFITGPLILNIFLTLLKFEYDV
jgi:predicted PurR-regulated permease PerM